MKKVSAIICAYNEEKTLKDVILSVSESLIVSEIIVVNDGSSDSTKKIIEELQKEIEITAIHLAENKGKGYAMAVLKIQSLILCYLLMPTSRTLFRDTLIN